VTSEQRWQILNSLTKCERWIDEKETSAGQRKKIWVPDRKRTHYLPNVGTQNFSRNMRSEFTQSEKKKFTSVIMTSSFKSHYKTISGRQVHVYKGMDIFRMYKKSVSRIQGHKKVRNVLFNDWFHTRVAVNHNPEPILSKIVLLR